MSDDGTEKHCDFDLIVEGPLCTEYLPVVTKYYTICEPECVCVSVTVLQSTVNARESKVPSMRRTLLKGYPEEDDTQLETAGTIKYLPTLISATHLGMLYK